MQAWVFFFLKTNLFYCFFQGRYSGGEAPQFFSAWEGLYFSFTDEGWYHWGVEFWLVGFLPFCQRHLILSAVACLCVMRSCLEFLSLYSEPSPTPSPASCRVLSPLFTFFSLSMIYLDVMFWYLSYLVFPEYPRSVFWCLINLGRFSAIITSNVSSAPFVSLFSFWYSKIGYPVILLLINYFHFCLMC